MSEIKELKELVVGLIHKVDNGFIEIHKKVDDGFKQINKRVDKLELKVNFIANDVSILKENVIRLNNQVFNKNKLF